MRPAWGMGFCCIGSSADADSAWKSATTTSGAEALSCLRLNAPLRHRSSTIVPTMSNVTRRPISLVDATFL